MIELAWQDYGIVGLIVGPILATFLWFVRAARSDLNDSRIEFRDDINKAHEDFTEYLKDTAAKQTEAMLAMANGLQMQIENSRQHEQRAQQRHEQLVARMEGIEQSRKQVSTMLTDVVHEVAANQAAAAEEQRKDAGQLGLDIG